MTRNALPGSTGDQTGSSTSPPTPTSTATQAGGDGPLRYSRQAMVGLDEGDMPGTRQRLSFSSTEDDTTAQAPLHQQQPTLVVPMAVSVATPLVASQRADSSDVDPFLPCQSRRLLTVTERGRRDDGEPPAGQVTY